MSVDSPRGGGKTGPARDRPFGTSLANRNEPLFTARHRARDSYEEPHFITDSLNTSFNPSPSPARPTKAERGRGGKGRKGLGATRRPTPKKDNVRDAHPSSDQPSSKHSTPDRGPSKKALLRTSTSNSPLPTNRAPHDPAGRNGTRTPSPRAYRTTDILSPFSNPSESSPPRGLAESYRRIQDEEFIAGHHESGSDEDTNGPEDQVLRDIINGELPRHLLSPTPSSRRSSRRLSPAPPSAEKAAAQPNAEGSRGSSPFEEVTREEQELNRPVSQSERDQQRVAAALAPSGQPFRKARKGIKLADGLIQESGSNSGSGSVGSHGSSRSSDPSLNIPAGWGRKARPNKSWLDRVKDDDNPMERSADVKKGNPSDPRRDDNVAAWIENTGEEVLDTIESDSFKPDSTEDIAQPLDLQPGKPITVTSELHDKQPFTAARKRNAKIEMIRQSEQATDTSSTAPTNLEASAAATELSDTSAEPTIDRANTHSYHSTQKPAILEPPKQSQTQGIANMNAAQVKSETPALDRSRDLLRSLARATSASPSPEPEKQAAIKPHPSYESEKPAMKTEKKEARKSWLGGKVAQFFTTDPQPSPERPIPKANAEHRVSSTPQITNKKLDAKTPKVMGAWVDTPATKATVKITSPPVADSPGDDVEPAQPEPAQPVISLAPKKPLVDLAATAPKLRTALADILAKAKADRAARDAGNFDADETFQIDDSTIESLEELLSGSENSGQLSASPRESVEAPDATDTIDLSILSHEDTKPPQHEPITATQDATHDPRKSRHSHSEVSESYSRLASRLTHLKTSISDAKDNVGSLQKRLVQSKARNKSAHATGDFSEGESCHEGGELHDFIVPCERCGFGGIHASHSSDTLFEWQPLQVPVIRLFKPLRKGERYRRPTRFGFWFLLISTSLILEVICEYIYLPEFYEEAAIEIGMDHRNPYPLFVLPQLLWGYLLVPVLHPIVQGVLIIIRVVCAVLGTDPGPFAPDGTVAKVVRDMFAVLRPARDGSEHWANWVPDRATLDHSKELYRQAAARAASGHGGSSLGAPSHVGSNIVGGAGGLGALGEAGYEAQKTVSSGGWFGGWLASSSSAAKEALSTGLDWAERMDADEIL